MTDLDLLSRGFRERYLDHDAITAQVQAWADAFPEIVRLTSLCRTAEGRDQWLLTIGPEPERRRPSVWVDGNMHAGEVCGSSVALAIAEDAIRLHTGGSELHGLPEHVLSRLREVVFHVLPRMSPDGAEAVLKTGRYVRSVPRDGRPHQAHPHWVASDVDGDGLSLVMRKQDPGGEFVESTEVPGLLLPRRLEDEGPFWKVWPEGTIAGFDGHHVPDPDFLSDTGTDLNRNFPWSWRPEPQQVGAGPFPGSEPESRAVVAFASAHPELFAWLNLHTFGGCFIRPLGDAPDTKMDPSDLALYRQVGAWAEALTSYPMVSGFKDFTYEPDKPLHGDLSEYAYRQLGCVSMVCELWDLFRRIGMERTPRFVDHYTHLRRRDLVALGRWDQAHNGGRMLRPWRPVRHPQLGDVEVGGLDVRFGVWNPPEDQLAPICEAMSAFWMRVAALAPAVVLAEVRQERLGDGHTAIELVIANEGYLPTNVLASASTLPWNEALWLDATARGCELVGEQRVRVGHLDGWGRGLRDGTGALYYLRSRGGGNRRVARLVVRGTGTITVRIGGCRTGWIDRVILVE